MSAVQHLRLIEPQSERSKDTLVQPCDVEIGSQSLKHGDSSPEVLQENEHVIPDGGWKAWCTVAGAFLILMCSSGYANSYGVFQAAYVEELLPNHSASEIAWIGTVQDFLFFSMGIPAGILFDARKFRSLTVSGSVLLVGCCFAQSAAKPGQYYQFFLSQGVGQGIGLGLMYLPAVAVVSQYFLKWRALVTGVLYMGSGLGGVIFPILINKVLQSHGFTTSVRATGYLLLGGLVLANLLIRPNYNPSHNSLPPPKLKTLLTDLPYLIGTLSAFFTGFGIFFPFFYIQLYSITIGLDQNISFYTLTIMNGASIFGRFIPTIFADRFGPITCQIPSTIISTVLVFVLLSIKTQPGIIAFCVLYGFFSGAGKVVSLFPPMIALMANSMAEVGVRMGLSFFVYSLAVLTGSPIVGALIGYGPFTWWKGIVFAGVCFGAGSGLMLVTRSMLQRKKGVKWI
ncbi:MFS general substrate transporter [Dacryopinax primogenitus]|uniref:MFS general substrate transporter n=1 Tax=Dacryopinax primogenitus (strain DJM 731) TaxID=1858805 RepID=M5FYR8_DACPD|nr:MFS general substrate transporter [Dacryopinax primogenitus]EJU01050.1 MFS general substrate transporter [Dacryopinax primogenitus]